MFDFACDSIIVSFGDCSVSLFLSNVLSHAAPVGRATIVAIEEFGTDQVQGTTHQTFVGANG